MIVKYVSLHDIEAHLDMGWLVEPETSFCHHHDYSVLMKWICECPIPQPPKSQSFPASAETDKTAPV